MKLTIKEIKNAIRQRNLDFGCRSWIRLGDAILYSSYSETGLNKSVKSQINNFLTQSEIAELKEII